MKLLSHIFVWIIFAFLALLVLSPSAYPSTYPSIVGVSPATIEIGDNPESVHYITLVNPSTEDFTYTLITKNLDNLSVSDSKGVIKAGSNKQIGLKYEGPAESIVGLLIIELHSTSPLGLNPALSVKIIKKSIEKGGIERSVKKQSSDENLSSDNNLNRLYALAAALSFLILFIILKYLLIFIKKKRKQETYKTVKIKNLQ